jgi:hypothetical protein
MYLSIFERWSKTGNYLTSYYPLKTGYSGTTENHGKRGAGGR